MEGGRWSGLLAANATGRNPKLSSGAQPRDERPWRLAAEPAALARQIRLIGIADTRGKSSESEVAILLGELTETLEANDASEGVARAPSTAR